MHRVCVSPRRLLCCCLVIAAADTVFVTIRRAGGDYPKRRLQGAAPRGRRSTEIRGAAPGARNSSAKAPAFPRFFDARGGLLHQEGYMPRRGKSPTIMVVIG